MLVFLVRKLVRAENRLVESVNKYGAIDAPNTPLPTNRCAARAVLRRTVGQPSPTTQVSTYSWQCSVGIARS
ncbi:MAG: hypothetical protein H7240_10255 [Glaciimonas sp.]|nr:hypothetical protein [Glaciimonas sp.]